MSALGYLEAITDNQYGFYIEGSQGQYDDYCEWLVNYTVYKSEDSARKKLNEIRQIQQKYTITMGKFKDRYLNTEGEELLRKIDSTYPGSSHDLSYHIVRCQLVD